MVERVITLALMVVMAGLSIVAASGVFMIGRGASLERGPLIFYGVRTMLLALAALAVVAALFSIRKRLGAIEAKLNDR